VGVCDPTVTDVTADGVATTKLKLVLLTELVPQAPVPPVVDAVTVSPEVVPAGVKPVVEIVSVDVVAEFETVVGLNDAVAPVGSTPFRTKGIDVQEPPPVHVVVIAYVAELP